MEENIVVFEDSNKYIDHLNDWTDDKLNREKSRVDKELESSQREYFDENTQIDKKMELQIIINHQINLMRAIHFQSTKRKLKLAFTPEIEKMLEQSNV